MGVACRVHGKDENCLHLFLLDNMKERNHLEETGIDGRIILKLIVRK